MASVFLFGLLLLALVGIASGLLAARRRLSFRLAVRNVRRGRTRTVLLILGLLVGTTIITGSLVIGDTVNAVNVHFVYEAYGYVDEGVYAPTVSGGYAPFNLSVAHGLSEGFANDPQVAGVNPLFLSSGSLFDRSTGIPQSQLNLIGVDPSASAALGDFSLTNGTSAAGPLPGQVLLDAQAAGDVNASVGDHVVVYGRTAVPLVVQGIVTDTGRGGFLFGGNLFVSLPTAQALENVSATTVNFVAITNAGTQSGGVAASGAVAQKANATLATLGASATGLAAYPILQENLARAESSGASLSTLFLVLGLFSIVAGVMLIVGIFVMLSEERKGEMGTIRAIGLTRSDLVYAYYFEGLLYSAGAALAGTFAGLGVAYFLTYAFSVYFASGTVTSSAILASFTASPTSLLLGYVVGFLLTLVVISITSWRVSRLNIVRAIRSVPEPPPSLRVYTGLAYLGAALAAVGAALFVPTRLGTSDISLPLIGGMLVLLGATLVATRFVRNRIAFSAGGAALLLWGGVEPLHRALLGSSHSGSIFVIFVEGILLVVGAIILYSFNSSTVVAAVARLLGRRPEAVAVARIGLSYPARRPFRTATTLTIFALVLFTIVAVASFGNSVSTSLGNLVQAESGGYTFVGFSQNPIPDLPGAIGANRTLAPEFTHVVPLESGVVAMDWPGAPPGWSDGFQAPVANATGPDSFFASNAFNFTSALDGWSASQVWQAVASDPADVVLDNGYQAGTIQFGAGGHPTLAAGSYLNLTNSTGARVPVRVVGIMGQSFISGVFGDAALAARAGIAGPSLFFFTVAPGVSPTHAGQLLKQAFFPYGLVLLDFAQVLQSSVQTTEAIVGLLEVFVALGLAVGIAAVGIVALRAVVERRAEIGMLRAAGFRQRGIFGIFLLEYPYVALLGIGIGTALGVLLIYEAAQGGASSLLTFSIPWANVGLVVLVSYLLTVLAVLGPSVRAARLPPAEAIRYSE